ncbi:MAG: helix-turn-helix domain-containing protein [Anaerolineaceae bacterium]
MTVKLTKRQEAFILNMLDLYYDLQQPLHYSELAERLGVSRFTAYDMLRLLEEKGFARSDYRLADDKSGPGRSEIVFLPTEKAHQLLADLAGERNNESYNNLREKIFQRLRESEIINSDLGHEVLGRIPTGETQTLQYCMEVMSVIAYRLKKGIGFQLLTDFIHKLLLEVNTTNFSDLALFGGFALGVLARENYEDDRWWGELYDHVKRYQTLITEMTHEQQLQLAHKLNELYMALQSEQQN